VIQEPGFSAYQVRKHAPELADLLSLWAAAHAYLVAQAGMPPNAQDLAAAYRSFVTEHNRLYPLYVLGDDEAAVEHLRPLGIDDE
jgi:hypothetical protein